MIIDEYAGPGGWTHGLHTIGLTDVGIELDADACATRAAAGYTTIRADLSTYEPHTPNLTGYIASPPCQSFSSAGSRAGHTRLDDIIEAVSSQDWDRVAEFDDRTRHVLLAARKSVTLGAEWITLEQVPSVLPVWGAIARILGPLGYSTWTGVLCAADYGVPQTRRRAVLIASRSRPVGEPPPTHANPAKPHGGLPAWVTMNQALGWDGVIDRRQQKNGVPVATVSTDRPAPTLTAKSGYQWVTPGGGRMTMAEALTIQTFPPDHPIQGLKMSSYTQIGNAIPPRLAAHVLAEATGRVSSLCAAP